jgi:thiamine-monophosphate kinase
VSRPPVRPGGDTLAALGEFGLIREIRRLAPARRGAGVRRGIGDDAAILDTGGPRLLLVTADMLVQGVHFDLATTSSRDLGRKALAVNLSDIAAMGGSPRHALVSLAAPGGTEARLLRELYRGLGAEARRFGVSLVGGDTCRSPGPIVVSVVVLGEVPRGQAVTRAGARPGDRIWVTGALGGSAAGLAALERGLAAEGDRDPWVRRAVRRHRLPEPRCRAGRKLAALRVATAMLDLSDGLASDLARLCEESGVGVRVFAARLPLDPAARRVAARLGADALAWGVGGGEDYELAFTSRRPAAAVQSAMPRGVRATEVGIVVEPRHGRTIEGPDGLTRPLVGGYDHFRPTAGG